MSEDFYRNPPASEPMPADAPLPKRVSRMSADVLAWIGLGVAVGVLALSAACLLGGDARFSAPSFTYIMRYVAHEVWGVLFFIAGALALWGQLRVERRTMLLGHGLGAAGALYWVLANAAAAIELDNASWTPACAYGILAWTHACLAIGASDLRRRT